MFLQTRKPRKNAKFKVEKAEEAEGDETTAKDLNPSKHMKILATLPLRHACSSNYFVQASLQVKQSFCRFIEASNKLRKIFPSLQN